MVLKKCNGIIMRSAVSSFFASKVYKNAGLVERIGHRSILTILKNKTCPGCKQCEKTRHALEYIGITHFIKNTMMLNDKALYKIEFHDSTETEPHFKITEVEE